MRRLAPWLMLLAVACEDPPPPPAPAPPPPPPPAPIAAGRAIASPGAFDLAPSPDGAYLAVGTPHSRGGGVTLTRLGPHGESLGPETAVSRARAAEAGPSQAVEVEMAAEGRDVVVAWVVDIGRAAAGMVAVSPNGGERFRTPTELGPTPRFSSGPQRGRLAAVAGGGTFYLRRRADDGPCQRYAPRPSCAFVEPRSVEGNGEDRRDGMIRELPERCDPVIAGSLARDGSYFHLLCGAEQGTPGPHVTVLDPDPQLAVSRDVAAGCTPVALAPVDGGAAVVARCADDTTWVTVLDAQGNVQLELDDATPVAECRDGRMVLSLREGERAASLALGPAVGRLEGLLPVEVAPSGARAVWTGEALLVAVAVDDRELSLRRYECVDGDRFNRTDVR